MNKTRIVQEIFILRSVSCLSIVLLHSIGLGLKSSTVNDDNIYAVILLDSLHVLLYFATPMFIFISEFLLAFSYRKKKLPSNFLNRRYKLILLPFLFMALFYSIPYASSFESWGIKFLLNAMIGDFHGYFMLIIFQFYFLHLMFHRTLSRWRPIFVLAIAFLINAGYLAFFHFIEPLPFLYSTYIFERFYWVPFFGWVFYFTLGYYCGYYYEEFCRFLGKYKPFIMILPIISGTVLLSLYHFNILTVHSSKRIDMLFHTTSVCFFIIYLAQQLKRVPSLLNYISQYSFGIYLLHMFYIHLIDTIFNLLTFQSITPYILSLFVLSTLSSIVTTYYLNKWEYGKYLVGQINTPQSHSNQQRKKGA